MKSSGYSIKRIVCVLLSILAVLSILGFITACSKLSESDVLGVWGGDKNESGKYSKGYIITHDDWGNPNESGTWEIKDNKLIFYKGNSVYMEFSWQNGKLYSNGIEFTKISDLPN